MGSCWIFANAISTAGYGVLWNGSKVVYAHRVMYREYKGEIPIGLELDHLCRNRACINPEHLEAVTHGENMKRGVGLLKMITYQQNKTHCPKGHKYTEDNIYRRKDRPNHRDCLRCRKTYYKRRIVPSVHITRNN